jgi:hypothetical protein
MKSLLLSGCSEGDFEFLRVGGDQVWPGAHRPEIGDRGGGREGDTGDHAAVDKHRVAIGTRRADQAVVIITSVPGKAAVRSIVVVPRLAPPEGVEVALIEAKCRLAPVKLSGPEGVVLLTTVPSRLSLMVKLIGPAWTAGAASNVVAMIVEAIGLFIIMVGTPVVWACRKRDPGHAFGDGGQSADIRCRLL